jgi:hypothetical protein
MVDTYRPQFRFLAKWLYTHTDYQILLESLIAPIF